MINSWKRDCGRTVLPERRSIDCGIGCDHVELGIYGQARSQYAIDNLFL